VWQLVLHFFAPHPILRARATKDRLECSLFLSLSPSYFPSLPFPPPPPPPLRRFISFISLARAVYAVSERISSRDTLKRIPNWSILRFFNGIVKNWSHCRNVGWTLRKLVSPPAFIFIYIASAQIEWRSTDRWKLQEASRLCRRDGATKDGRTTGGRTGHERPKKQKKKLLQNNKLPEEEHFLSSMETIRWILQWKILKLVQIRFREDITQNLRNLTITLFYINFQRKLVTFSRKGHRENTLE